VSTSADISKMLRGLGQARERARAAGLRAMDIAGEKVLGDAQQLCPVDTGFLQSSATSEPAVERGNKITKQVGFNADYAAAVHENLTAHHEVGQAKFLETAIKQNARKLREYVASEMRKAL
jgi:hypothetical protein